MSSCFAFAKVFNLLTPWIVETKGDKICYHVEIDGEDSELSLPFSVQVLRSNFRKMQNREPPMERIQELASHLGTETLWNLFRAFLELHRPDMPSDPILVKCFQLRDNQKAFERYLFGMEQNKLRLLNYMMMLEVFDRAGTEQLVYPLMFGILTERSVKCLDSSNLENFANAWGLDSLLKQNLLEGSHIHGKSLSDDLFAMQQAYLQYVRAIYGLPGPAPELAPFHAEVLGPEEN